MASIINSYAMKLTLSGTEECRTVHKYQKNWDPAVCPYLEYCFNRQVSLRIGYAAMPYYNNCHPMLGGEGIRLC